MKPESDAALWLEAIAGTHESFALLFDRHRARVFRHAYRYLGHLADAEDAVAVVFLEAWKKRSQVRIVDGSILPWLLATTGYVVLNANRSSRRYQRLIAAIPVGPDAEDPAIEVNDSIDKAARAKIIRDALLKLNSAEQRIVELCVLEELPMSTTSTVLEIPVGTVKSKLSRAKQKLKRYILENPELASYFDDSDTSALGNRT